MAVHLQPPCCPGNGSLAKHTAPRSHVGRTDDMDSTPRSRGHRTRDGLESKSLQMSASVTAVYRQPRTTRSRESYFLLPAQRAQRVSMGGGNQAATQHPWRQTLRCSVNRTSRGMPASVYIHSQNAPNKKALILRLRHRENTFASRTGAG